VARVLAAAVALGVVGLGVSRVPDLAGADAVVADTPAVLDAPAEAGPDPSTDGGSRVVGAARDAGGRDHAGRGQDRDTRRRRC
jgi:hypothetical protein